MIMELVNMNTDAGGKKGRILIDANVDLADKAMILAASKKSSPPRSFNVWAINTLLSVSQTAVNEGYRVVKTKDGVFVSGAGFMMKLDASVDETKAGAFVDYLNVALNKANQQKNT